jgi:hypothetical protein
VAEKLPLLRNVRWFQLAYGAFLALVLGRLYLAWSGLQPLGPGPQAGLVLALAASLLVFVVYLQNVHRFGLVPDYSLKCWSCHGPVNRYSEFCEHCGADLISPERLVACPRCGAESIEGTPHCPECGARLAPRGGKGGGKGKGKGRGKGKAPAPEEAEEGWDQPIDVTTGIPPPRNREDEDER